MSEARGELTSPEQRAAHVMVRFAAKAGYRGLRWSVPNDSTWREPTLAAVPVRHDGLLADSYDLLGHRRLGADLVICSLLRRDGTFDVLGVPSEEWLRPLREVVPPPSTAAPPRQRATALALGLLVPLAALGGGVAVVNTASQGPDASAALSPAAPAPITPTTQLPAPHAGWASEAEVAMASVREQLAVLAEAERAWNAIPAQQRAGELPAAVRDLLDNRTRLEQQLAALEADLTAWRAMQQTTEALAGTEEQLGNVTRALQLRGPSNSQLREQQAMLIRQRDAQREQLEGWSEGVETAVGTPLPDPQDMTPLAGSVLAITQELPDRSDAGPGSDNEDSVLGAVLEPNDQQSRPDPAAVPEEHVDVPGIVPGAVLAPVDTGPVGHPLDFLIPGGDVTAPAEPVPALAALDDALSVDDLLGEIGQFGPTPDTAAPPAVRAPVPPAPASELPAPKDLWDAHRPDGW